LTIFARNSEKARTLFPKAERVLLWAPGVPGEWQNAFEGVDAVINLAGEPIAGSRWTRDYKQRISDSRVRGTREIVDAMRRVDSKPAVLVSASAVGYYGNTGSAEVDEESAQGTGFLPFLCGAWEKQAQQAAELGIRVVLPRLGIVLAKNGGALQQLVRPYRFFAGGPLGSGRQYVPWIHIDDLIAVLEEAVFNPAFEGPVNAVAPQSVTNRELASAIGHALHRPSFMPAPGFMLRLLLGGFAATLIEGQHVVPARLKANGFRFAFPGLSDALNDILIDKHEGPGT
jgi:uncharacterized protein (TIGR01777 family)